MRQVQMKSRICSRPACSTRSDQKRYISVFVLFYRKRKRDVFIDSEREVGWVGVSMTSDGTKVRFLGIQCVWEKGEAVPFVGQKRNGSDGGPDVTEQR